ncbi:glutaconyl-CoA decarboxylase subunit beta [Candidatus Bathyarchaeota archaeon]|nr:MAG: glutaconyl-CoA decarboxylase subunit beta [Candidatus Bathyarchaeota archaeon]
MGFEFEFLRDFLHYLTHYTAFNVITLGQIIMMIFAVVLIYLAISKEYEPFVLLPIGIACLLSNVPLGHLSEVGGLFYLIRKYLIDTEILPIIVFICVGAMTDFGPLLSRPLPSFIMAAAAQLGIFITLILCLAVGYPPKEAAAIGIIGSADGPTTVYTCAKLAPEILGPVAASCYLYMAMVPIIQPPIVYALTTKKERATYMPPKIREVSKIERILFPVFCLLIGCLLVPHATPLIGAIAIGNLFRESGVVDRLAKAAENELLNISTILLGLGIGGTLTAEEFLKPEVLLIFVFGIVGFAGGTVGGLILGKIFYIASRGKINPIIGIAGVSAVPMTARVSQYLASKDNPRNFILMHAMGPNIGGVIASAIAAGYLISIFG